MSGSQKCVARLAYEAHRAGEINAEQMETIVAFNVAETLTDHEPIPYAPAPHDIRSYLERRINQQMERDERLAFLNGLWLDSCRSTLWRNAHEVENLIHWRQLCVKAGGESNAQAIYGMIEKHARNKYPQQITDAARVQKMDSEEKRRSSQASGRKYLQG